MPTYVYKDLATGEIYEFKQSMKDDAYTVHPETGAPIKRMVSAPAIAFKGSGFYATDSRAAQKKVGAAKADPAKSEASKPDAAVKSDTVKAESTKTEAPKKDTAPKVGGA